MFQDRSTSNDSEILQFPGRHHGRLMLSSTENGSRVSRAMSSICNLSVYPEDPMVNVLELSRKLSLKLPTSHVSHRGGDVRGRRYVKFRTWDQSCRDGRGDLYCGPQFCKCGFHCSR